LFSLTFDTHTLSSINSNTHSNQTTSTHKPSTCLPPTPTLPTRASSARSPTPSPYVSPFITVAKIISNTLIQNAANYVSESIQGATATTSKEANKEQAKGNVPGKDSLTDRASGALDATSDKLNEKKHEGSASANKQGI
jgi:Ras-related protein Rap-1B